MVTKSAERGTTLSSTFQITKYTSVTNFYFLFALFNAKTWPVENEVGNLNKAEHSTKLNFLIYLYTDVEKIIKMLPFLLEVARSIEIERTYTGSIKIIRR